MPKTKIKEASKRKRGSEDRLVGHLFWEEVGEKILYFKVKSGDDSFYLALYPQKSTFHFFKEQPNGLKGFTQKVAITKIEYEVID